MHKVDITNNLTKNANSLNYRAQGKLGNYRDFEGPIGLNGVVYVTEL